ncbi:MAG: hypothetical protein AAF682_23600 [Planctomycetota bacterium]
MRLALLGCGLIAALAWAGCKTPRADFQTLVSASDFIVEGEVRRLGAATLEQVEDTSRTVVVRVDRVLYAPDGFADYTGREITVLLAEGHDVEVGERAVFYTRGWLFGDGIAVVETGVPPGGAPEGLGQIADLKATEGLRARLDAAALVAQGSILRVDSQEGQAPRRTEHDPRWTRVTLDARAVLKGDPRDGELVFLYPASRDVHWFRAPRPAPGLEGVFLLHRRDDLGVAELVVIEPEDVQPIERLSEIQGLLEGK